MMPLLLCVAEKERPGRLEGLDDQLFHDVQAELGVRFHPRSAVIGRGRVAGALAMVQSRRLIHEERLPFCIIAGVDSFLVASTLFGFIPGEAGAAILVGPQSATRNRQSAIDLLCLGIGTAQEKAAVDSEEPLRADGMVLAFKAALTDAGCTIGDLDFRITDSNGEQYWFKEATLALDRILRNRKELFEIWHPADCIGEIGAAVGPCALGIALQAARKDYAFGRGPLCHFSAEDGQRVALVMKAGKVASN
jgi:3-oxoacyl-[acyl-carrier-protein] synthase-1